MDRRPGRGYGGPPRGRPGGRLGGRPGGRPVGGFRHDPYGVRDDDSTGDEFDDMSTSDGFTDDDMSSFGGISDNEEEEAMMTMDGGNRPSHSRHSKQC